MPFLIPQWHDGHDDFSELLFGRRCDRCAGRGVHLAGDLGSGGGVGREARRVPGKRGALERHSSERLVAD